MTEKNSRSKDTSYTPGLTTGMLNFKIQDMKGFDWEGGVLRALACRQFSPGLIPAESHMWIEFAVDTPVFFHPKLNPTFLRLSLRFGD